MIILKSLDSVPSNYSFAKWTQSHLSCFLKTKIDGRIILLLTQAVCLPPNFRKENLVYLISLGLTVHAQVNVEILTVLFSLCTVVGCMCVNIWRVLRTASLFFSSVIFLRKYYTWTNTLYPPPQCSIFILLSQKCLWWYYDDASQLFL